MRISRTIFLFFGLLGILATGAPSPADSSEKAAKDVIVIGNKKLPVDELTPGELKDIFQRKKTMWENGQKISFALLDGGRTHQQFVRHYIQKTPAQYHRYWKKLVFSGRGVPPITFRSERSLMAHIALTSGAIGYVSADTRLSGVKEIKIVEKSFQAPQKTNREEVPSSENQDQTAISANQKKRPEGNLFNNFFN